MTHESHAVMVSVVGRRVLVTGEDALAREVAAECAGRGADVTFAGGASLDLTRQAAITRLFSACEPDIVVHVDSAEGSPYERITAAAEVIDHARRFGAARCVCVIAESALPNGDPLAALLQALLADLSGALVIARAGSGEPLAPAVVAAVQSAETMGPIVVEGMLQPGSAEAASVREHCDEPVEEILDGEQVIAVILRGSLAQPGVSFYSRDNFSQQLGFISRPAGHIIPPHVHNEVQREVMHTQETLFIREGRVRVDLYRDDRTLLTRRTLATGDVILLCTGGHGFEILDDSAIVEVKQGPYAGDGDKTRFEAPE